MSRKTILKSTCIVITIFLFFGCDLLTTSGVNEDVSVLPDGEKDIQLLRNTTWVSLPGQKITGRMPDTESWYTLGFYETDLAHYDSIYGGIHYYTWENEIGRGNYYFTGYTIDDAKNINRTPGGFVQTEMLPPVYEDFSFAYFTDWIINGNNLFILYDSGHEDGYILEFEELTEDHPLSERYTSEWPYK